VSVLAEAIIAANVCNGWIAVIRLTATKRLLLAEKWTVRSCERNRDTSRSFSFRKSDCVDPVQTFRATQKGGCMRLIDSENHSSLA